MALIICSECGKEFSEFSNACPNCGCPISVAKKNTNNYFKDIEEINDDIQLLCPKCGMCYSKKESINLIDFKCKICKSKIVKTDMTTDDYTKQVFFSKDYENKIKEYTNKYGNNQFSQEAYEHRLAVIAEENRKYDIERKQKNVQTNVPKCPTCGSTNIEKISFTKKALSIGGLGILSNKIGKTYQCKNCKTTW